MTDIQFTASATFDRELFWKRGQSVRYLVARVNASRADGPEEAERTPLNMALVIDASGSMAHGKLEAAKEAAMGLAERLAERDRLTLVSFASDIVVHLDAVPVTEKNALRIRNEIMALHTRGMTCLSGGWFAGAECAARLAEDDADMTPRVIILSDGLANKGITDREELWEHAGELRQRGVLTSTLGIGNGYDEFLLRGIAEGGGGRLHDAELAAEIRTVLLGELDDIAETLVDHVVLNVDAPESMAVEPIGRVSAEGSGRRTSVALGPVQNGVERFAVFKVTCPEARRGERLAFSVSASGRAVDDGSPLSVDAVTVAVTAARGRDNSAQARDGDVALVVARAWSADIVQRAARLNRDGNFRAAHSYVRRELKYFARYVEGLESGGEMIATIENLGMLADRVGRKLSQRLSKEMMLESALAMESRRDKRELLSRKANWKDRIRRGE